MSEVFKMDNAYRQTDEYKELVAMVQKDAPWMPLGLIEYAIIAHKTNPQYYKTDKNSKKILSTPLKQPIQMPGVVVHDAVKVGELTPEIEKQREEFWKKHTPQDLPTIEEVEA